MKKVSIIGHFGSGYVFLDGQTVKTKIITEELRCHYGENEVTIFDTHGGAKAIPGILWNAFMSLKQHQNVIILPAHNGLRVIAPWLCLWNCFFKKKLHYIVIGGWLPEFLNKHKLLAKVLMKFDGIYVETDKMRQRLHAIGLKNVFVMPNCKQLKVLTDDELIHTHDKHHRLCTFSRVVREKGIQEAVDAVTIINKEADVPLVSLDIYGQVDQTQTEWFEELQGNFPDYIQYKGLVPFDKSVETLMKYDALLFPTYYEGEGFAGTIIDALAAGVPVIASDWRYNSELIKPYTNGLLVPCKDVDALADAIRYMHRNVDEWNRMKHECLKESKQYMPGNALKVLFDRIEDKEEK